MNTFLFQYLPYIAGALFVCGVTYRIAAQGKTVQAYSTQFLSNDPLLKWGSNLFHVGIILVFFGHIFGLLAPEWAYDWLITNEQKRQLAIVMGSGAGLITLVGICLLTLRRFTNSRVVANSHLGDYLFVVLIFLQIVTGLLGTVETVNSDLDHYMNLDRWAQGLFTFLFYQADAHDSHTREIPYRLFPTDDKKIIIHCIQIKNASTLCCYYLLPWRHCP